MRQNVTCQLWENLINDLWKTGITFLSDNLSENPIHKCSLASNSRFFPFFTYHSNFLSEISTYLVLWSVIWVNNEGLLGGGGAYMRDV